jgi:hypothetical protein
MVETSSETVNHVDIPLKDGLGTQIGDLSFSEVRWKYGEKSGETITVRKRQYGKQNQLLSFPKYLKDEVLEYLRSLT